MKKKIKYWLGELWFLFQCLLIIPSPDILCGLLVFHTVYFCKYGYFVANGLWILIVAPINLLLFLLGLLVLIILGAGIFKWSDKLEHHK